MSSQPPHGVRLAADLPITLDLVRDVIAKGWIAAVRRGLVDLPEAEADAVLSRVAVRLDEVLELARRVELGSRTERLAAVEDLIDRTGVDTPELIDFASAAVRLGVRETAELLCWATSVADVVERCAVYALIEFDRQIETLVHASGGDQ